jgi:CRP-like cAMP-binding protein
MNLTQPSELIENRILAGLNAQEFSQLFRQLEPINLNHADVLYEIDDSFDYVYFPNRGIVSLVSVTESGDSLEIGLIGYEGIVGLPIFFGAAKSPYRTIVQVAGRGMRVRADYFRSAYKPNNSLQAMLLRYTQATMTQITQIAICNRFHSIESRLARWLLLTQSRLKSNEFYLTQEFLAQMLGTQRPAVTVAAGILQNAGFIRYNRGNITLTDQQGLESASCECLRIIIKAYNWYSQP